VNEVAPRQDGAADVTVVGDTYCLSLAGNETKKSFVLFLMRPQ
jgi:hypothetical protein